MFDFTSGPARERIDAAELARFRDRGALVLNDNLRRPLWFDGRFIDAAAMIGEQQYFLRRQAAIARAVGVGVTQGLTVDTVASSPRALQIAAGHGLTPAGELVILPDAVEIDLADIPEMQKLDASFGLLEIPREPARNRTGLFIVALRPVEFTAEPIASYPTTIDGPRSVEAGTIVEATAVTLIPYPDKGARTELRQRRRHVAREIFIDGSTKGQPAGVLPLAMVALNLGVVEWLDPYLVRREVGSGPSAALDFGRPSRALAEAFLRQYRQQLGEILGGLGSGTQRFPASDHFLALPPAGPLPPAAVDPDGFTQVWFPAEMDVDVSIVPEDEMPALIEESLALPPIDLTLGGDEQESTSVMITVPVPRPEVRRMLASLRTLIRPLRSTAPGVLTKRRPIQALAELRLRRAARPTLPAVSASDAAWREVLGEATTLWYVRRRNVHYKAEVVASPVTLIRDEASTERLITDRLRDTDLFNRFTNIRRRATTGAEAEAINLLAAPTFTSGSNTAIRAAVSELSNLESINRESVLRTSERFSDPAFGEGITRLERLNPAFADDETVVASVAESGRLPELDALARELPEPELRALSAEIVAAATADDAPQPESVASLISARRPDLRAGGRLRL